MEYILFNYNFKIYYSNTWRITYQNNNNKYTTEM